MPDETLAVSEAEAAHTVKTINSLFYPRQYFSVTRSMAVRVKREADNFNSDFDTTPTTKVKVEKKGITKASPMKWTLEDAKIIKKLREEKVDWKFFNLKSYS